MYPLILSGSKNIPAEKDLTISHSLL